MNKLLFHIIIYYNFKKKFLIKNNFYIDGSGVWTRTTLVTNSGANH